MRKRPTRLHVILTPSDRKARVVESNGEADGQVDSCDDGEAEGATHEAGDEEGHIERERLILACGGAVRFGRPLVVHLVDPKGLRTATWLPLCAALCVRLLGVDGCGLTCNFVRQLV